MMMETPLESAGYTEMIAFPSYPMDPDERRLVAFAALRFKFSNGKSLRGSDLRRLSMSRSLASSGFCFFLHSVVVSLSLLLLVMVVPRCCSPPCFYSHFE